jgi:hypothetical protein
MLNMALGVNIGLIIRRIAPGLKDWLS